MSATTPEKCPKCGSNVRASIPDVGIQFECAAIALESGHFSEALPCVMRQRDQLAERVRILEAKLADRDEATACAVVQDERREG